MDRYLYRGVSLELFEATSGKLVPKAIEQPFSQPMYWGGGSYWGDGGVYGNSPRNAVVQHQRDSNKNPTSGVSTTPIYERAKYYATHHADGRECCSGYIYRIDTELLNQYGVRFYIVAEHATKPTCPEDEEIILVASNFGVLPAHIVVDVTRL